MPPDSSLRRIAKRTLAPVLRPGVYRWLQAASMTWDIRAGRLTEPELALVAPGLEPGETAIDLGANYGMYMPALSRAVGRRGRVIAYEPIPFTVATLRIVRRLLRLGNVTVHAKAVGEVARPLLFSLPIQEMGAPQAGQAHAIHRDDDRPGREQHIRWQRSTTVECEAVTLDEHLAGVRRIALIKADIEGCELFAFRGAVNIIERDRPTVICEINPWFLDGFGLVLGDLLDFFSERGYALYRMHGGEGSTPGRLVAVLDRATVDEDNYVFIHPTRRPRFASLLESVG